MLADEEFLAEVYRSFLTEPQTRRNTEGTLSSVGNFWTKVPSRLSDSSIDALSL